MNNVDKFGEVLQAVQHFADRAHGAQLRRYSGERYITHPIRVMETCRVYTDDIDILCACLLHDVLEDTTTDRQAIHTFLSDILPPGHVERTLHLVVELTDVYTHHSFPSLNRRMRKKREVTRLAQVSPEAQMIKCADIIDNATNIFIHDPDFAHVYLQEGRALLTKMNKGIPQLYQQALKTVSNCLELLESKEAL
jgi:(p)ppGpp synthase/HD superfamily hydrolase